MSRLFGVAWSGTKAGISRTRIQRNIPGWDETAINSSTSLCDAEHSGDGGLTFIIFPPLSSGLPTVRTY